MSDPILEEILQITEALLISTPEPLTPAKFRQSLERDDVELSEVVALLKERFEAQERPVDILPIAGGYQLVTRAEYQPYLQRLFQKSGRLSLTRAGLETLAIVAYRQPVARPEVDHIRGVNSESALHTLLQRELITIKGRDEGVGRPLLYGTTPAFLEAFGLNSLGDLPKLKEIDEIMGAGEALVPADHAAE